MPNAHITAIVTEQRMATEVFVDFQAMVFIFLNSLCFHSLLEQYRIVSSRFSVTRSIADPTAKQK